MFSIGGFIFNEGLKIWQRKFWNSLKIVIKDIMREKKMLVFTLAMQQKE